VFRVFKIGSPLKGIGNFHFMRNSDHNVDYSFIESFLVFDMNGKLVVTAILGILSLVASIYISVFSFMEGEPFIYVGLIYNYSLIISLFLLLVSFLMLSYAYYGKIDIVKSLLYPFGTLSLLFAVFYPTLLIDKLVSFALSLLLFQVGFKKGGLKPLFFSLDFLLFTFFIYDFFIFHSYVSLLGLGASIASVILTNKGNLKLWSPLMVAGIPLLIYSVQISPLSANLPYLGTGAVLTAISLVPARKGRSPFSKAISLLQKGEMKKSIEIVKKNRNKMSKLELAKFGCEVISKGNCEIMSFVYKDNEILNLVINSKCSMIPLLKCLVQSMDQKNFQEISRILIRKGMVNDIQQLSDTPNFSPEWLLLLAREFNEIGEKEKYLEYLDKSCKRGFKQACIEMGSSASFKDLNLSRWDPKVWKNEEIYGYKVLDVIGQGGSGYVLKCYKSGGYYALKIPSLSSISNVVEMLSESAKLNELSDRSNYIVRLYGVYADRNDVNDILAGKAEAYLKRPPVIVMELMEGGSSEDLRKIPTLVNSEAWKKIVYLITARVADALSVVHSEGYVHCDVKPQNILFQEKIPPYGLEAFNKIKDNIIKPKLADLGSAVREGGKPNSYTPYYAPFDQVGSLKVGGIRRSVDIYALGASAFKLLTGEPLNSKEMINAMLNFEKGSDPSILDTSLYSTRDYSLLNGIAEQRVIEFIEAMTSPTPNNRPSAEEVRDFFLSISKD